MAIVRINGSRLYNGTLFIYIMGLGRLILPALLVLVPGQREFGLAGRTSVGSFASSLLLRQDVPPESTAFLL